MKIGDLLYWHDKPHLLAVCIAIHSHKVVVVKWVNPEADCNPKGFHAYMHNFKKVRTE